MSQLFIHPYLDEDVSVLIATLLRSRGFDATTTVEASNSGATDDQQLAFASGRQMALLTHNRADFEALARQYIHQGNPTTASSSRCDDHRTISCGGC